MAGARFKGSGAKLAKLIHSMENIGGAKFRKELHRKLGHGAYELAMEGFERSISPYGTRWRKPRRRDGQPLLDTGALRASILPTSNAESFGLATPIVYAAPHQYGWPERNIPMRQFFPSTARGLGGRWRKDLFAIAHDEVMRALERRR